MGQAEFRPLADVLVYQSEMIVAIFVFAFPSRTNASAMKAAICPLKHIAAKKVGCLLALTGS